jgi:hypothetical protein
VLLTPDLVDISYLFDYEYLASAMNAHCPQVKILRGPKELGDAPWVQNPVKINPVDLAFGNIIPLTWSIAEPEKWRDTFDSHIALRGLAPSAAEPLLVNLGCPLFQWPMVYETREFKKAFGRILQFRHDVRELAAEVLYELSRQFFLDLDPSEGLFKDSFFGAHLRTAKDAAAVSWPGYEVQSRLFLDQAIEKKLSVIYVSSGSSSDMSRFQDDAQHRGIKVTNKAMLLKEKSLETLQSLTWDQQGIVDFEVLLKASDFGGISRSSFSWNVAMRRNVLSNLTTDPRYRGPQSMNDEFSTVYGYIGEEPIIGTAIWP